MGNSFSHTYVDIEVHPLPLNAAVNIPPPAHVDTGVHPLPPDAVGKMTPPADVDTGVNLQLPDTAGNIPPLADVDTGVLPPHTPNTIGNILQSVSMDIDVHVQPQNATENKNISTPTDVDTDVHPQAPNNAGNILSPVDVNTGPGSRMTLKSLFLQESIYKDIVDNLSAKVAEKWVKECCNKQKAHNKRN